MVACTSLFRPMRRERRTRGHRFPDRVNAVLEEWPELEYIQRGEILAQRLALVFNPLENN